MSSMGAGIAAKILAVHAEIGGTLPTDKELTRPYRHKYTSKEALIEYIRPLCVKNRLAVTVSGDRQWSEGVVQTREGEQTLRCCEVVITLMDADSGESHIVKAQGSACDAYDKAIFKAQTTATRYAIEGAFMLSTGGTLDADESTGPGAPNLDAEIAQLRGDFLACLRAGAVAPEKVDATMAVIDQSLSDNAADKAGCVAWLRGKLKEFAAAVPAASAPAQGSTPAAPAEGAEKPAQAPQETGPINMVSPDGGLIENVQPSQIAALESAGFRRTEAQPTNSADNVARRLADVQGWAATYAQLRPDLGTTESIETTMLGRVGEQYPGMTVHTVSDQQWAEFKQRIENGIIQAKEKAEAQAAGAPY